MTGVGVNEAAAPFPPISWAVKTIILVGAIATATAINGMSAVLPKIETALAHTPEEKYLIKMLVGAVGAAMVIGAPLTGFLSDRFGLRRIVIMNWFLFAAAGTAGLYLNELPALVVARFLLGLAAAGAVTSSIIIVNRLLPPDQRAKWMGRYVSLSYVATIGIQPLVGQLAERSWHYPFAIYFIGLPFAIIALVSFPSHDRVVPHAADLAADRNESLLTWFPFRFAFIGLAIGWITYLTVIYMPFVLRNLGIGPAKVSLVLMGDTLTGILASLLFGRARRRLSSEAAFFLAFFIAGIATLTTSIAPNYATVMVGMAILGLAGGWFLPNLMLAVGSSVQGHRQGRTTGLVKACNYLAMPLGVTLMEPVSQLYGPRIPIMISSALAFGVAAVFAYRILSSRQRALVGLKRELAS